MTVALANAIRKGWFAYMNNEKGHNLARADRTERQITAYCQNISAADEAIKVAKETTRGSHCVDALTRTMKSTVCTSKLLEYTSKAANLASKAVNPILCVASLSRAMAAEDKKSAFIKESGCMLGMFAFEGVTKSLLGLGGKAATYGNYKSLAAGAKWFKGLMATNKFLSKLPTNRITGIIKAVAFVAASCLGFALGGKVGETIANKTTAKDFAELKKLQKEQAQFATLTVPKNGNLTNAVA